MTKFILVRHGKANYNEILKLGFTGQGLALAPLSEKGINQIKNLTLNDTFLNSDLLISSPYTRAIQSASIIGKTYDLDIHVEPLLHEWIPNNNCSEKEFLKYLRLALKEWETQNPNFECSDKTESLNHVKKRALLALSNYTNYNKVIVVTHALLIYTLTDKKLNFGEFTTVTSNELEKTKTLRRSI